MCGIIRIIRPGGNKELVNKIMVKIRHWRLDDSGRCTYNDILKNKRLKAVDFFEKVQTSSYDL